MTFSTQMQQALSLTGHCYRGYLKLTSCAGSVIYFRSHPDVATPVADTSTAQIATGSLSSNSQTIDFNSSATTIGGVNFRVLDFDDTFKRWLASLSTCSITGATVQYFAGAEGVEYQSYHCVFTYLITGLAFKNKGYNFTGSDPTRLGKTEVFNEECLNSTGVIYANDYTGPRENNDFVGEDGITYRLDSDISIQDQGITPGLPQFGEINIVQDDPEGWSPESGIYQGDEACYIKVDDEIMQVRRAFSVYFPSEFDNTSGTTRAAFRIVKYTIHERGSFGTPVTLPADNGVVFSDDTSVCKVSVISGPAAWTLYAVMTGKDIETGATILSDGNHAAIDDRWINTDTFLMANNPTLWRDNLQFINREGVDAKQFWESQILQWIEAYFLIDCDGRMNLTPRSSAIDRDTGRLIERSDIIRMDDITEDLNVFTAYYIAWDKNPCEDEYLQGVAVSLSPDYIKEQCLIANNDTQQFDGLRSSFNTAVQVRNRMCQRLGNQSTPLWRSGLTMCLAFADILPGDKLRVVNDQVSDYHSPTLTLDRVFEVSSVNTNFSSGTVTVGIVARSKRIDLQSYSRCLQETSQPCATDQAEGRSLLQLTNVTAGNVIELPAGDYYIPNDFTLDGEIRLTTPGTLGIVIDGVFNFNGLITTVGLGQPGLQPSSTPVFGQTFNSNVGFGNNQAQGGITAVCGDVLCNRSRQLGNVCIGNNQSAIVLDGFTDLLSIDLTGNGGCAGGPMWLQGQTSFVNPTGLGQIALGGAGGNGGGGLYIGAQGFNIGASAVINTSGNDGIEGSIEDIENSDRRTSGTFASGSGAGGNSGRVVLVQDGGSIGTVGVTDAFMNSRRGITPNVSLAGLNGNTNNDRLENFIQVTKINCT